MGKVLFFLSAVCWGPYFPSGKIRMHWDFFVRLIMFFACAYIPFFVCFGFDINLHEHIR